ncbi:MAG: FtsX-like permease family protein, partial [Gammaproteobacteria bacterium]|nr:FtsX-like permease family protein [Gammaproteobacteria bacterium]
MTPSLLRASTGYLLRHPWQLGLAVLGICIGVAVMVAVDLANESARKAYLLSMDTLNGRSTHQVVGGPGGLDESVYRDLRVVHGIRTIAPVITGYVNAGGETTRLLGIDVFAEREFRAWTSPANIGGNLAGREEPGSPVAIIRQFLTSDGAVLLSADVASRLGVLAGDGFGIVANGRSVDASAAGVISADDGRFAGFIVADIAVAQRWLGMAGRLSRIDVRIDQGIDGGGVAMEDELAALLPPGASLLPSDARTKSTIDMSNAFMTNLTAMSFLAMLVGVFLIYNSIAFAVIQRRDLIGILRALGVTRAQTFRLIVGEAAVLGLVGAGLGILLGTWLGRHLLSLVAQTVSDHYFLVNVTDVDLAGGSLARAFAAGIGATLVAAAIPALEASSYAPRLALLRSTVESKAGRALPVLAAIGCATIVLAAFTLRHSGASLVAALAALFALVLGFSLCIPVAARAAVALLAPVAGRIAGVPGRLAIGGIAASLSRTGVAMVALAVAVSATVGVSLMVESFRMSVSDWLGNTLRADIYVGVSGGSLDPELVDELAGLPEVRERSLTRRAWLEGDAGRSRIIAIEMAAAGYAGTRIRDGNPAEVWAGLAED